jgi:hypothetical protein
VKPTAITEDPLAPAETPLHDGSHRRLLTRPDPAPQHSSRLDAIIVPTARPTDSLLTVIDIAARLGCPLLVLCSRRASASQAVELARPPGVNLIAIDTGELPKWLIPSFETNELLLGTPFELNKDLSRKRNIGLLFARLAGWQRIVFLDDDIDVPQPRDLRDAVALLDTFEAVGLSIGGFPDNSVVCHAYRDIGGSQDTFIGGGALAVNSFSITSFFPQIYNEDWFFLLDGESLTLRPSATTGVALQKEYDPFADQTRARSQEFGDCLAEGVYWLLDRGMPIEHANADYWTAYLQNRREFITGIADLVKLSARDLPARNRMVEALRAAAHHNRLIDPALCVAYLKAWREDCATWRDHVETLASAASGKFWPEAFPFVSGMTANDID